ncbi:hypothetical protein EUX98_g5118 [Antrodiella citrinella]|uniref:DUF7330 domain-containing protein n=1 Tax=Antrodiella citrinella TaxID=2447956 RepID=A0A4S4MSJ7_9APHY|nr:hypothetical protein EUX98_g5118 [Antrodiella citrinella]
MIIDKNDPSLSAQAEQAPALPIKDRNPESRLEPPQAAEDLPPPYVDHHASSSSHDVVQPYAGSARANSHTQLEKSQEVNQFILETRQASISGSYILNLELPPQPINRDWLSDDLKELIDEKQKPPCVSLFTRQGCINLKLTTAGSTSVVSKARVMAHTRQGKVHVNIHTLHPNKRIYLEASSRQGMMSIFVPPNFVGTLKLETRQGKIKFLPEFERRSRLISAPQNTAIVLFGGAQTASLELDDLTSDCCLVSTRQGSIVVGVSGIDPGDNIDGQGWFQTLKSITASYWGSDVRR